ncbi:hypothetical protein KKF55_06600 [Patescibacteria group bacterium]|nr:hypothetical protein [Patescibacteria group bacterium]
MFIIIDAAIFLCLFFTATRAALLLDEGVYSAAAAGLHIGMSALALLLISIVYLRYIRRVSAGRLLWSLLIEQAVLLLILILLFSFAHMKPAKGVDNLWFGVQWNLFPVNFRLMSAVAPSFTVLEAAAFIFLVWLGVARGKKHFAAVPLLVLAIAIAWQTFDVPSPKKHIHYLLFFALPPILAAASLYLNRPRLFGRFLILSAAGLMVFWYYTGFLPLYGKPSSLPGSVEILYPSENNRPDFPLMYMRNFIIDEEGENLYTTFGPTSGIIKLNIPTARAQVIHTRGLARSIALDEKRNQILVLDWDFAELLFYSIEPFEQRKSVDLFEPGSVIMPWAVAAYKNRIYLNICGFPGLAVYDRQTMKRLKWLPYRRHGMTRFNYGAEEMLLDTDNDRLFVHIGPVDVKNRFSILRISLSPARIEHHAKIPEGGMGLLLANEKNSLFIPAFYSRRLYELDADTLEVKRVLEGVLNSRNVVYDPARNVLFTTGFLSGVLAAIDYDTGKIIRKIRIGKRSNALLMDVKKDVLYVGCSWGILKVNPGAFVGGD